MDEASTGAISGEARIMTTFQWKIPDFFRFPSEMPRLRVKSPIFSFLEAEWQLYIYPNGLNNPDWIALYLMKFESANEKHVAYHFGVRDGNGIEHVPLSSDHHFIRYCDVSGSEQFMKISALRSEEKSIAPQGTVTIVCMLHSKATDSKAVASQTMHTEGAEKLVHNFKNLLLSGEISDMILKVQNKEFRVHSAILAARSSVFAAMMRNDLKERRSGVTMVEDCEPDIYQQFLKYMYSGDMENFSMDTVCALFDIADKYNAGELKTSCILYMMDNLSVEKFCDVLSLSLRHNESELLDKIIAYFAQNLKEVLVSVKWMSFVKENPVKANEMYIKAVEYCTKSE